MAFVSSSVLSRTITTTMMRPFFLQSLSRRFSKNQHQRCCRLSILQRQQLQLQLQPPMKNHKTISTFSTMMMPTTTRTTTTVPLQQLLHPGIPTSVVVTTIPTVRWFTTTNDGGGGDDGDGNDGGDKKTTDDNNNNNNNNGPSFTTTTLDDESGDDITSSPIESKEYNPDEIIKSFQDTSYYYHDLDDMTTKKYEHMSNEQLQDPSTIPGWENVHSPPIPRSSIPKGALVGTVVSTKMTKTINVAVLRYRLHPKYRKRLRYTRKFMAHDESETARDGDVVLIVPCQRISKHKHFLLREIVRPKGQL